MIKKYIYNEKEYTSYQLKQLRHDLFVNERKCIAWPDTSLGVEKVNEVLNEHGITYVEEPDPEIPLETLKARKLTLLERAFMQWYEVDAVCTSSLGFVVDSDVRAVTDVSGLITVAESTPEEQRQNVAFMDHENQPHMLNLDQLNVLRLEIIQNGQSAYQQKWAMRESINGAQSAEDLDAIEIKFNGLDFSKA